MGSKVNQKDEPNSNQSVFQIPLILHEAEKSRSDALIRRLMAIIMLLIAILSVSNLAWFLFTSAKSSSTNNATGNTDSIVVNGGDITLSTTD